MENNGMTVENFLDVEIKDLKLDIIMSYDGFVVMKVSNGKTYVRDEDTKLVYEVIEVHRISWSDNYGDMSDEELIGKYDADYTGELDDCSAYVYYKVRD